MENEILIIDMNVYRYKTNVNFKNKEIPLKLNPPKNDFNFYEWAMENNFEYEAVGDYNDLEVEFEIPLNKYIEYLKIENN